MRCRGRAGRRLRGWLHGRGGLIALKRIRLDSPLVLNSMSSTIATHLRIVLMTGALSNSSRRASNISSHAIRQASANCRPVIGSFLLRIDAELPSAVGASPSRWLVRMIGRLGKDLAASTMINRAINQRPDQYGGERRPPTQTNTQPPNPARPGPRFSMQSNGTWQIICDGDSRSGMQRASACASFCAARQPKQDGIQRTSLSARPASVVRGECKRRNNTPTTSAR